MTQTKDRYRVSMLALSICLVAASLGALIHSHLISAQTLAPAPARPAAHSAAAAPAPPPAPVPVPSPAPSALPGEDVAPAPTPDAAPNLGAAAHNSLGSAVTPSRIPPIGQIEIPKIGLVTPVYEGVDPSVLSQGPGHWPGSAMPGQLGNTVWGGHRTTFSHPFENIDQLVAGDQVIFDIGRVRYLYVVTGSLIVSPADVWITNPTPTATGTIFACHPPHSAAQRYVVKLALVSPPALPPGAAGGAVRAPSAPAPSPVPVPSPVPSPSPAPSSGGLAGFLNGLLGH